MESRDIPNMTHRFRSMWEPLLSITVKGIPTQPSTSARPIPRPIHVQTGAVRRSWRVKRGPETGSADDLQRLAVRAEEGYALIQQVLEKDLTVFLHTGKAAKRLALGVQQDVFKAPALGAVEDQAVSLLNGKAPALPQGRLHMDGGAMDNDAPLVDLKGVRDGQSHVSVHARYRPRVFIARSISRLASRRAADSRLS